MRKSKKEAEETRKRIVEMAADEFRQHGIATSSIADLMAAAGLTHGGFYRHFDSKEQLVAEATAAALDTILDTLATAAAGKKGRNGLKAASAAYLSAEHRDNLRHGCPLAALGSELARSDKRVRDVATTGFSRMVEILVAHFDESRAAEAMKRAMATAAAMIGAVTMSRVLVDQKLSDSLLQAVKESIARLPESLVYGPNLK
jgi:TetR/AcrR family transcriptional regulator, transcriptional repressor for nem operon